MCVRACVLCVCVCLSVCMHVCVCIYTTHLLCVYLYLYHSFIAPEDSVYLEKYRSVCRELELLNQRKNSEYDEELDDLRATKRNLERKVMTTDFDNDRNLHHFCISIYVYICTYMENFYT